MTMSNPSLTPGQRAALAQYLRQAEVIILARQDADSGLLPASTAITVHGDYTHAWVRDNVYSILAIWGLALAHRGRDAAQAERLAQSGVRLMRGLLASMMRQAGKVEAFKHSQNPLDALHAKYDTRTGQPVVGDGEWGHLQLDATSLFVLMLAQMSASGLQIIASRAEVDFVQNLAYYLSRADRTPDYGIWERGHKRNSGVGEVNASSVGMAKAALEAIQGFSLLPGGAPAIHVPGDDIANMRTTLMNLLPRESQSKEIDAALLAIISFPAFAVENPELVVRTRDEITTKLAGAYGCKRFLRDGHQTVLEDHSRLHYEPGELALFEHIESEWPLFFTYLCLDALMRGDAVAARDWRSRLEGLLHVRDGEALLPELYYVPAALIDAERNAPGSQAREPNENVPLVWAQSLFLLAQLLDDGLVTAAQLDPLQRRRLVGGQREIQVQLVLLASDPLVAARLAAAGIRAQTREQMAPVEIRHPDDLENAYSELGRNLALGLSGRPARRPETLATSQVYVLGGQRLLFLPHFAHNQDSYLHLDNRMLMENLRTELPYLRRRWFKTGQPLIALRITEAMLDAAGASELLTYLVRLQDGGEEGVHTGLLAEVLPRAHSEKIDWLDSLPARTTALAMAPVSAPELIWQDDAIRVLSSGRAASLRRETRPEALLTALGRSRNPYEHIEILQLLWARMGPDYQTPSGSTVRALAQAVFERARWRRLWGVVRRSAGLLERHDEGLEDAIAQIVLRQKRVAVGRAFNAQSIIEHPIGNAEIVQRMQASGVEDPHYRAMVQEVLIYLGMLIKADRTLLGGTLTLRAWHLLRLVTAALARDHDVTQDEAFDHLLELSPYAVLERLRDVIVREREMTSCLAQVQSLHFTRDGGGLVTVHFPASSDPVLPEDAGGWMAWRELGGVLTRAPEDFYERVWELLRQCKGLVIGDQLDSRNRVESALAQADMTRGEKTFELQIEDLMNKIQAPEYRQLCVEALLALSHMLRANWGLRVDSYLVLDVIIGHGVRLNWLEQRPEISEAAYGDHVAAAWNAFYASPPHQVANAVLAAVRFLLNQSLPPADPPADSAAA